MRGATTTGTKQAKDLFISTHAPLAGRDRELNKLSRTVIDFNPRAPCGARLVVAKRFPRDEIISTHAPLAGRDNYFNVYVSAIVISTHAPLAGRDKWPTEFQNSRLLISTHAPLAGRDAQWDLD